MPPAPTAVAVDMGEAGRVTGTADTALGPVVDAFVATFTEHGDVGAGLCVYRHGEPVLDLTGGWARVGERAPYDHRTLQLVFSATKGATACCALLLAQSGALDLEAPVADVWPAFGAAGKERLPVRMLLTHQAGLPTVDAPLSLDDALCWDPVVDALAAQAPLWEPGSAHGYHALTFGWLVGEVVRRVSGRRLGRFMADEVAGPLGMELYVGLPAHAAGRVAPLRSARANRRTGRAASTGTTVRPGPTAGTTVRPGTSDGTTVRPGPTDVRVWAQMLRPGSLSVRALTLNGAFGAAGRRSPFNRPELWAAEVPAANGITNARSLARLYAAMIGEVDGVRLLAPETVRAAGTPWVSGPDRVLVADSCFGLGFQCHHPTFAPLLGPGSFGHDGMGGTLAFAQPELGLAFAYVTSQLRSGLGGDDRAARLLAALRSCC